MAAASGALLAAGAMFFLLPPPPPWDALADWLWAGGALTGLWFVLPSAWQAARRLRPDMNLLMTIAVIGAGLLGDWFEAASTACLFSFALFLETWTTGRARRSVQALLDVTPRQARVLAQDAPDFGREVETPVEAVAPGSVILVKPGEAIPLDGVILQGETQIDEAPLTGESLPVFKAPGSPVHAGAVNGDGVITMRTTKTAQDTTLARIMRQVQEAQGRRAAVARWVDRFAAVYTPVMMLFALLTALLPPLLGFGPLADWIGRGLVVLVASCPCALVISTPVTVVAGLTSAVRRGVLIKGGVHLEAAARLEAVALDKTGTLTAGVLKVTEAVPAKGRSREELLALARTLEAGATHPVGRAIHAFAQAAEAAAPLATNLTSLPGLGMRGEIAGTFHYAGSPRLFTRIVGREFSVDQLARPLREGDAPQALVFTESALVGAFLLADAIRPESARAVADLKALGVGRVVMLTGDAATTAARVGGEAGVDAVHAGLMPEEKVACLQDIQARFGRTAMVGDGVNDAPALATADLGVAMGVVGTDAAIETADIALMSDDLRKLPWLIAHSRRTLSIVRQNMAFSLITKGAFIVLALTGAATLWMAVAADMGTSLAVIANGLRLLAPGDPREGASPSS